jgi:6-phosphogluconate dehydrogenase
VSKSGKPAYGLIGLGTMGSSLVLNIAEKGYPIAVYNRTASRTTNFVETAGKLADQLTPCLSLDDFVAAIQPPRSIVLMLPAGEVVDQQIAALRPLLGEDDLIIDAGNANFRDTNRRAAAADKAGVPFLGIGVSGGEEGARHGPSIMGGGPREAWDRVAEMLRAISARYDDGTPCATWMGQAGAGHFVKMVHNGIEYADMQMIAELYGVMRDGMGYSATQCAGVFERWNEGPLASYLIEISAKAAQATDPSTGRPVIDIILDQAGQKGTGRWTAIEAQHLAAPVSVIEAAVGARNLSAAKADRQRGEAVFGAATPNLPAELTVEVLEQAMIAGKILCYAQGFDMLSRASREFGWSLPLPDIAKVWRAGCIIRSNMLNDMAASLEKAPADNLVFADYFADLIRQNHAALRQAVATAIAQGLAVPALAAGVSYLDQMRAGRSTANLIQAQRDFFGAHGFKRTDQDGDHHGPWGSEG